MEIMEKIRVSNDEVLRRVKENKNILNTLQQQLLRWVGRILGTIFTAILHTMDSRMLGKVTIGKKTGNAQRHHKPADPRYRLALRARHDNVRAPPKLNSWIHCYIAFIRFTPLTKSFPDQ